MIPKIVISYLFNSIIKIIKFNSVKSTPRHKVYEFNDSRKWRGVDLKNPSKLPGSKNQSSQPIGP